jgi:predicted acylesterase/phospholipase RssA
MLLASQTGHLDARHRTGRAQAAAIGPVPGRRVWPRLLCTAALSGAVAGFACTPLKVDSRSLFAKASYVDNPSDPPSPTPDDMNLQVFANLELETVMAYRHPPKMAACLEALANWDERKGKSRIQELGEQLASHPKWASIAVKMELPEPCKTTGEPDALVRFVVARIANSVAYMANAGAMTKRKRRENVYRRVPPVLDALAKMVASTNPGTRPEVQDSVALALRGGAANGAFSAGFLFELLSLRQRSLPPEGDGGNFRFSAMVGTSVGALIAQILDLYFVDMKPETFTNPQQKYVEACRAYWNPASRERSCEADVDTVRSSSTKCFGGWPTNVAGADDDAALSGLDAATRQALFARYPLQMCALTQLYRYFTDDDEQTLMCVEPGPITRIAGKLGTPDVNLMRFDPMASNVIAPLLDAFSGPMIANDVPRVVVAVELENNQLIGLDERTCEPLPSSPTRENGQESPTGREYCLGAAVMASAVIPAYARPVRHLYEGVSAHGFCGSWFDGGLRSVFPAYRALRMTRPALEGVVGDAEARELRVLAVGTGPLQGLPQRRPTNILEVTLDAEGQATGQNDLDEVIMARQMALVREQQLCDIMKAMDPDGGPTPCEKNPDPISDDASVSAVYVPAETPAYIVEGAEYSFDRTLMRGLWVWGRHVAIERVLGKTVPQGTDGLFTRLGWGPLQARAIEWAKADARTLKPWLDSFKIDAECPEHRNLRMKAGQYRITHCVPDCRKVVEADPQIPQYYVCPRAARRP